METIKFRTNIKCSGCVAKVTPHLNETAGTDNWEVDINNPEKILTVVTGESPGKENNAAAVKAAVEKAGFKAGRI